MEEQKIRLIESLNEFNLQSLMGLSINYYHCFDKYSVVYSNRLREEYWNFITNIKIENKKDFERIIQQGAKILKNKNRKTTIAVMPFMKELYNNRLKYFDNNYEISSTEVWQIYENYEKIETITTNNDFKLTLEISNDMDFYAEELLKMFQTGDESDPYGNLTIEYKETYANYKQLYPEINTEFYIAKINNEIVGVSSGSYNKDFYGIHSLAVKKEYRRKGIGKEIIKKQLQIAKDKKTKLAMLQTEEGFYPADLYRKLGFKDLCICYYYTKIE